MFLAVSLSKNNLGQKAATVEPEKKKKKNSKKVGGNIGIINQNLKSFFLLVLLRLLTTRLTSEKLEKQQDTRSLPSSPKKKRTI